MPLLMCRGVLEAMSEDCAAGADGLVGLPILALVFP